MAKRRGAWFAGALGGGRYEVGFFTPGTKYGKPRGAPDRWLFAFGPYSTKGKAVQVAMYQSGGREPKIV